MRSLMNQQVKKKVHNALLLAAKIGCGSALAIAFARILQLENPTSAGTITLLTLLNTKWGTLELIARRLMTFILTLICSVLCFAFFHDEYLAFGAFLIVIVFITELLGWQNTLSVNALIGMHFMSAPEIDAAFIGNEFSLLLLGIVIAFVLNLFYDTSRQILHLNHCVERSDQQMKEFLVRIVVYLRNPAQKIHPWKHLDDLHDFLIHCHEEAEAYEKNTFRNSAGSYTAYFLMREKQLSVLDSLHDEFRRARKGLYQKDEIASLIEQMVAEFDLQDPRKMTRKILEELKENTIAFEPAENLPFEEYAFCFHILQDLEELIDLKEEFARRYVSARQEVQLVKRFKKRGNPDAQKSKKA